MAKKGGRKMQPLAMGSPFLSGLSSSFFVSAPGRGGCWRGSAQHRIVLGGEDL